MTSFSDSVTSFIDLSIELNVLKRRQKSWLRKILRMLGFPIDRDIDQKIDTINLKIDELKKTVTHGLKHINKLIDKCSTIINSETPLSSSKQEKILAALTEHRTALMHLIKSNHFDLNLNTTIETIQKYTSDLENHNRNLIDKMKLKETLNEVEKITKNYSQLNEQEVYLTPSEEKKYLSRINQVAHIKLI